MYCNKHVQLAIVVILLQFTTPTTITIITTTITATTATSDIIKGIKTVVIVMLNFDFNLGF